MPLGPLWRALIIVKAGEVLKDPGAEMGAVSSSLSVDLMMYALIPTAQPGSCAQGWLHAPREQRAAFIVCSLRNRSVQGGGSGPGSPWPPELSGKSV